MSDIQDLKSRRIVSFGDVTEIFEYISTIDSRILITQPSFEGQKELKEMKKIATDFLVQLKLKGEY